MTGAISVVGEAQRLLVEEDPANAFLTEKLSHILAMIGPSIGNILAFVTNTASEAIKISEIVNDHLHFSF